LALGVCSPLVFCSACLLSIEWQEETMQLRHIRPGSLEWQDAQAGEVDDGIQQLTPEEVGRLRKLASEPRGSLESDKPGRARVH
jgi:hypothetical protein